LLVLTRRVGERVRIGPAVLLTALESGGGRALLEIATPLPVYLPPSDVPLVKPVASPGAPWPRVEIEVHTDAWVMLGAEIGIMIVSAKNDVLKLGLRAPKHVQILREEVYEKIAEEMREAALTGDGDVPELPDSKT
jgi:carbon storage regulator